MKLAVANLTFLLLTAIWAYPAAPKLEKMIESHEMRAMPPPDHGGGLSPGADKPPPGGDGSHPKNAMSPMRIPEPSPTKNHDSGDPPKYSPPPKPTGWGDGTNGDPLPPKPTGWGDGNHPKYTSHPTQTKLGRGAMTSHFNTHAQLTLGWIMGNILHINHRRMKERARGEMVGPEIAIRLGTGLVLFPMEMRRIGRMLEIEMDGRPRLAG